MFSPARCLGALAVVALCALASARADDNDPVYEGKKVSEWVAIVQDKDSTARKKALAIDALSKAWIQHGNKAKDAIPTIGAALRTDTSAAVRAQAAVVFAGMRARDRELFQDHLVEALKKEKESRVRKEIVLAILKFPEVCALAVDPLVEALKDPDNTVKIAAAEALALAGGQKTMAKSAAPGLVPLLKDTDKAVRMAAVYALGRIQPEGASTVAETMCGMLGTEKDADMKRELITAIGLLSEKSGVVLKALGAALFDADDDVRRRAARVLGTFGTEAEPVAEELLKVVTTDKAKDIRVDAVRAFGSAIGPAGVKARLKDLRPLLDPAKQPDFEVRLALVDEIAALGWEHIGQDLVPFKEVVAAVGTLVGRRWEDFDRDVTLLHKWGEAQTTLVALRLRQSDPQVTVRKAADAAVKKVEKKPEPKKEPEKKEP